MKPLSLPSLQNNSDEQLLDTSTNRSNRTGFSSRAIWTSSGIIRRIGCIGFTTAHSLQANKTSTQMAGYIPHLQRQVRHTILWFYIWTSKSMKWQVLPVISRIGLSSVDNRIQLWNAVHSRRRDGTRKTRISELLPRRTWESTRGGVQNPNHRFHHGKHPTCGWYMWQHKLPQTSFETPRISNIVMETIRSYLPSIGRLPLNWLRNAVVTRIWAS